MGAMEISNPRRILAVSLAESAEVLGKVIKDLTGTHPSPSSSVEAVDSLAGTTHILSLSTQYYKAEVPVWLDLVSAPSEWSESFLSEEAREVLAVLGGLIVVFSLPSSSSSSTAETTRELISQVGRVVKEGLGGWDWDGVCLAICISDDDHHVGEEEVLDEWDDLCAAAGLEFVHHSTSTTTTKNAGDKNEFGEKMGMQRVIEALQANDWSAPGGDLDDDDSDDDSEGEHRKGGPGKDEGELDPESLDFGFDRLDFEGLRKAIWSGGINDEEVEVFMNMNMGSSGSIGGPATETMEGDAGKSKGGRQADGLEVDVSDGDELNGLGGDEDIRKIEGMMLKLQAVRDMSAGMPDEQRKRMAKQAVDEVMREL